MLVLFVMGLILVLAAILLVAMAIGRAQPAGGVNRSIAVLEAMGSARRRDDQGARPALR